MEGHFCKLFPPTSSGNDFSKLLWHVGIVINVVKLRWEKTINDTVEIKLKL